MQKCWCGKEHMTRQKYHACLAPVIANGSEVRDGYQAITHWEDGNEKLYGGTITTLFRDCLEEDYVDFDQKGRGSALNHDLYGYDPNQGVAVIQARQAFRHRRNHFLATHKTYFLCGHNEITGSAFRHPISAPAVRGAIRAGADAVGVVMAAQRWMWQVTEKQLQGSLRQGDLLLVPERGIPDGAVVGQRMTMTGSHEIHAQEIRLNGRVYALNPQLIHTKGQHAPTSISGWASVRVARDVPAWDFATRVDD